MSTDAEMAPVSNAFCLSGDVSVRDVRQMHTALCEAVVCEGSLEIDASQLTSIDTAVVQLLLAARRAAHAAEIKLPADPDVNTVLVQIGAHASLSSVMNNMQTDSAAAVGS